MLANYDEAILDLWFGEDEDARMHFGQWLVDQERFYGDEALDLLNDNSEEEKLYEKKIRKLRRKECETMDEILMNFYDIIELEKEARKRKKKHKKLSRRDLGIATYMNNARYKKSFLNNDDYRKYLRKLAKQERDETKEMVKLGYIQSNDPDKELKKLMEANSRMSEALSDSYIQKYFVR